jgi:hypothetical protein
MCAWPWSSKWVRRLSLEAMVVQGKGFVRGPFTSEQRVGAIIGS